MSPNGLVSTPWLLLVILYVCLTQQLLLSALTDSSPEQAITRHCDMESCDSIVIKCTLNKRCSCNLRDAKCARDCVDCLEEKFGLCCGCVDLCPVLGNDTVDSSHVGDLPNSDQQYFEVLTESDDIKGRWSVVDLSTKKRFDHPQLGELHLAYRHFDDNRIEVSHDTDLKETNCKVAFINKRLSMTQCKLSCRAMGATFFRWFHDGNCCECIGRYCMNYGVDEAKCVIE